MTHLVHCDIDPGEATLRRLVGAVERRGFHIASVDVATEAPVPCAPTPRRRVALLIRPREEDRSLAALGRYVDRLYGVRWAGAVAPVA